MSQNISAQTPQEFAAVWEKSHITNKFPSNVRLHDLKIYLEMLKKQNIEVKEVGRSFGNREIYQIEWGHGPIKVLMWSQMHGDEPTATSALIDMFSFLESNKKTVGWVGKLEKMLTIRAIPMLNPDGAEIFVRRNLQGIDINRDARSLRTPEAALLMRLRNEFVPDIGFNLHNQGELTTAGSSTRQAAISVLAVRANPKTEVSSGQRRNTRICSLIVGSLREFIPGNIARYDDTYTESAFGDTFSDLGTPVILIETGGLHGKDELFLTKLNFIAFLTALQSIADESEAAADVTFYNSLPQNSSGRLHDFIFREASIVDFEEIRKRPGVNPRESGPDISEKLTAEKVFKPFDADVAVAKVRRREEINIKPITIRQVGDLSGHRGLVEYNAKGFYLIMDNGTVKSGSNGALLFYRKDRDIDWNAPNPERRFAPDSIFARGRWIKGGELFDK